MGLTTTEAEAQAVENWRLDLLLGAGFPLNRGATLAADRTADVHEIVRAVADGCDVETAWRIYRP